MTCACSTKKVEKSFYHDGKFLVTVRNELTLDITCMVKTLTLDITCMVKTLALDITCMVKTLTFDITCMIKTLMLDITDKLFSQFSSYLPL